MNFEITAIGFDGGSDDTDDRVLWVSAPDLAALQAVLQGVPHQGVVPLDPTMQTSPEDFDFALPNDAAALQARLRHFADHPQAEKQWENHYRHCGQVWTDTWSCCCNDRCPVCNREIEPFDSVEL